jgi:hypothetical protein
VLSGGITRDLVIDPSIFSSVEATRKNKALDPMSVDTDESQSAECGINWFALDAFNFDFKEGEAFTLEDDYDASVFFGTTDTAAEDTITKQTETVDDGNCTLDAKWAKKQGLFEFPFRPRVDSTNVASVLHSMLAARMHNSSVSPVAPPREASVIGVDDFARNKQPDYNPQLASEICGMVLRAAHAAPPSVISRTGTFLSCNNTQNLVDGDDSEVIFEGLFDALDMPGLEFRTRHVKSSTQSTEDRNDAPERMDPATTADIPKSAPVIVKQEGEKPLKQTPQVGAQAGTSSRLEIPQGVPNGTNVQNWTIRVINSPNATLQPQVPSRPPLNNTAPVALRQEHRAASSPTIPYTANGILPPDLEQIFVHYFADNPDGNSAHTGFAFHGPVTSVQSAQVGPSVEINAATFPTEANVTQQEWSPHVQGSVHLHMTPARTQNQIKTQPSQHYVTPPQEFSSPAPGVLSKLIASTQTINHGNALSVRGAFVLKYASALIDKISHRGVRRASRTCAGCGTLTAATNANSHPTSALCGPGREIRAAPNAAIHLWRLFSCGARAHCTRICSLNCFNTSDVQYCCLFPAAFCAI